uniref:Probable membrane transporter protein n=1 Tax=Gracilinema caldarium TaxID=215591 RepID=A0A7C3IIJ2_9SPIR
MFSITVPLLLRGLLAALIVGFVTSSIRSWVDRVFLVIMLTGVVGLPIVQSIQINLIIIALAALMALVRQRKQLHGAVPPGSHEWWLITIPAFLGGVAGRVIANQIRPTILLGLLGVYAIMVGLRIFIIKPLSEKESKAHPSWFIPVSLGSGLLTGLISAGGKPFAVPLFNNAMGHHPQKAYALATVAVVTAAWTALGTQLVLALPSWSQIILALYEFVLVTLVALIVQKFWTEKLAKIVHFTIAPILILVGIRFLFVALR